MPPKSWWTPARRAEQAERARENHRTGKLKPPRRRTAGTEYDLAEKSLRAVLNARDATNREKIAAANSLTKLVRARDKNIPEIDLDDDALTVLSDGELTALIHDAVAAQLFSWRNASGRSEQVLRTVFESMGLAFPNEQEREELRDRFNLKLAASYGPEHFRKLWPDEASRLIERGHKLPQLGEDVPGLLDATLPARELREAERRGLGKVAPEKGKRKS